MKTYLVGGAVRDRLLDLPVGERDWVVVGATEIEMLAQGFTHLDRDFPVFAHPETGEECALARTETKTGPGYKGFEVYAGSDVSLEDDLRRRDLTINAIAEAEDGSLIDPFGGREDLDNGLLRHVSPAFVEDPVRLLRIARFAARFGGYGFRVAHGTWKLLKRMVADGEVQALGAERVWAEFAKSLVADQPWRFVESLHRCGALGILMPELAPAMGASEPHANKPEPPPMAALRRIVAESSRPEDRFAVLVSAALDGDRSALETLCERLRVPRDYRECALRLLRAGDRFAAMGTASAAELLEFLELARVLFKPEELDRLLLTCRAVWPQVAQGVEARLHQAREAAASVRGDEIRDAGLTGPAIRDELARRRCRAIEVCLG